jgi:mannitol/fructose-specific phosphotransferase system IIA component (Ntr-type)
MPLADIFVHTAVLDGGPDLGKAELVCSLLERLPEAGHVPPAEVPSLLDAVLCRERLGSTGIGRGVAIPHARHPAVPRTLGILAVCRAPVEYASIDGEPVDIVALLLSPPARPDQHLGEVARRAEGLPRLLANEDFCRRLRQAGSAEEIMEIVQADGGMTRREWLACKDLPVMLLLLQDRGLLTRRKAGLFVAACCRSIWAALTDEVIRRVVEVAERFADGLVTLQELRRARKEAGWVAAAAYTAANAAVLVASDPNQVDPGNVAGKALAALPEGSRAAEQAAQATLLRCIFGYPFRPVLADPAWRTATVAALACAAYDERILPSGRLDTARLAVLCDALLDAGCPPDHEILLHLRRPGPHWRGSWAVDVLMGKE